MHTHLPRLPRNAAGIALAVLALAACSKPAPQIDAAAPPSAPALDAATTHPAWSKQATIYEVNIRQYTPEGTLAAFTREIPRLKGLGVDILWIMPVQPIGRKNRKGTLGSYYSIADYRAINPEFGTMADFRALVKSAHDQGLKVILDWVPNHTAFDHPWTTAHPDFYNHNADGSISVARNNDGTLTDWTDVADLNYENPALRQAMIGELRWWVDSAGIDGFRQDVAWGVPHAFWKEVHDTFRPSRPDLFFLAEAEDAALHASFDATYAWELHHLLNAIAQGKQGFGALTAYFERQAKLYNPGAFRMSFTSDHDENSWQGTEFERMGANHQAAFILASTVQGSFPLLYTGQEVSLKKRLRFFDKDTVPMTGASLADFYTAVFALKHTQEALANGAWGASQVALANTAGERVFAFTRTKGANTVLVAVNFSDAPIKLAYSGLAQPGAFTDWFSKAAVTLAAAGQLDVPAHGWRVLTR